MLEDSRYQTKSRAATLKPRESNTVLTKKTDNKLVLKKSRRLKKTAELHRLRGVKSVMTSRKIVRFYLC